MNFIKGSRAGLAVAVAGFGIGIAMIIDSALAEKKFRDHKQKFDNSLQLVEEGVEHFTERNRRKKQSKIEQNVIIEDHFTEPDESEIVNILNENDEVLIKKNEEDENKMLPGETYADWYVRVKEIQQKRNPYYGLDMEYTGDGSDASKALYLAKRAYVEAKAERDMEQAEEEEEAPEITVSGDSV